MIKPQSVAKVITTLRELNEPVPRPFRLPTEVEIATTERKLGLQFPTDYRYFLLHASNVVYGAVEPAVVVPDCGHLDLVEMAQTAWQDGVPRNFLPFCESNGDYYCFTPEGCIRFWSHDCLYEDNWLDLAHWILNVWIEAA